MSGTANIDRVSRRRQQSQDEILQAAWDIVREKGLAGLALRDLGDRVGMRAQSLYSYFANKGEIYDAMFADGYRAALAARDERLAQPDLVGMTPDEVLRAAAHHFFAFCTSDPVRYQLLFQRTIPDFEPSADSYALAIEYVAGGQRIFADAGIDDPRVLDLWTALLTGLTDQQISNDPGGDRWARLIDDAMDMFLAHVRSGSSTTTARPKTATTSAKTGKHATNAKTTRKAG